MYRYGLKRVRQRATDSVAQLSWQAFEALLAQHYRDQGYRVEHVGTGAGGPRFDGGVDLKLFGDGEYIVVQCKHWNVFKVTHNPVHELLGVMRTQKATGAIFVTSGEYTEAAKQAAGEVPELQLVDGKALRAMLGARLDETVVPAWTFARQKNHSYRTRLSRTFAIVFVFGVLSVAGIAIMLGKVESAFVAGLQPSRVTEHPRQRPVVKEIPKPASIEQPGYDKVAVPTQISDTPMTEAELKAWKRKNAEAMKILARTTPEI